MGILSGLFRSRDKPTDRTAGSSYSFFLGGTAYGKYVTERSAMQMTAVYCCVRILSEAVASLPLQFYRYTDDAVKRKRWNIRFIFCSIIEKWNLIQYDVKDSGGGEVIRWYRVRKSWADAKSQKGAYKILDNAKKCVDQNPGYKVFDADGKEVYEPSATELAVKVPFLVKVSISDLNIRIGNRLCQGSVYSGRGVHDCGSEVRERRFRLGKAEERNRMDLVGFRPEDLRMTAGGD